MVTGITEIAVVILFAAVLGLVARALGQPPILAYLVTGAVISYFGFFHLNDLETFRLFSDLGIMFLLFLVGLEINYTSLKRVGKTSLIVGLGQIIGTSVFGFLVSNLLGFSVVESLYIGIALTFSSTIIIVRLLSGKSVMNSLYGKLSVGFLLVQDFVAILILIVLAGFEGQQAFDFARLGVTAVGGIALFALILVLSRKVFPYIFDRIARSQELLFLVSLAWLFSLAGVLDQLGFSIEIGGFLAGLALANSSEHFEISARMRPLRDFFMVVFFAILGSSMLLVDLSGVVIPVIVLSLFVLVFNPLIVISLMGLLGYKKRVSFLAGITVAQISEFSLIIASKAREVGHIGDQTVAIITGVGVITITLSTYLISEAEVIFEWLSPMLDVFEREDAEEPVQEADAFDKPFVLVGFHELGKGIASNIDKEDLLVIDFDPDVVEELEEEGYTAVFGDVSDLDTLDKIDFEDVEVVISTSPSYRNNLTLVHGIQSLFERSEEGDLPKLVVRAKDDEEARILYENGADYVMIPGFVTGNYVGEIIGGGSVDMLDDMKEKDLARLKEEQLSTEGSF